MIRKRIIAIDFDGTIFENAWPEVGTIREDAVEVIQALHENGNKIIIWTCRGGENLKDALNALEKYQIPYDAVNENIVEMKTDFNPYPKIYYDILIDDRNLGGVLNWKEIGEILLKEKNPISLI